MSRTVLAWRWRQACDAVSGVRSIPLRFCFILSGRTTFKPLPGLQVAPPRCAATGESQRGLKRAEEYKRLAVEKVRPGRGQGPCKFRTIAAKIGCAGETLREWVRPTPDARRPTPDGDDDDDDDDGDDDG